MLTHKGNLRRPRRYHPGGYATPQRASLDMPRRVDQPPVRGGRCDPHDFHYHYPLPPREKGLGGPTSDDRGIAPGLLPGDSIVSSGVAQNQAILIDGHDDRQERNTDTNRMRNGGDMHCARPAPLRQGAMAE